jgi:hypothetical protein
VVQGGPSCTVPGSGDVGECVGGEANAGVPPLSAPVDTATFIVDPWNCCPQFLAEICNTARHVAVVLAPPVPRQLQIVSKRLFVVGASWERLAADCNVLEGGLLPFGMLVLLLSPLIAAKVRGVG